MSQTGDHISGYAAWKDMFPDFALLVEKKELKCHKSFLARYSAVMDRMLNSAYIETQTGQMEIRNFDLKTVTSFVHYIYAEDDDDIDDAQLTPQLLEMAHMYEVEDLEKECIDYLKDNMTEENAVDVWGAAEKCRSKILLDSVQAFIIPGMEGPRGTVLNQTPGIDRVAGPLGKKLLDSLHTRYESLHVEYSEAASTNEVLWVESQAEKRSLLKELLYEFKCYYHYTNTEHICHTGYFVTVAKDANEILWQFPSMSSLEDPNFDNLTTHPDIFGTTAAAIKGKQMHEAEFIVFYDIPSSIEEYQEVIRQFVTPSSYIVTYFSEEDCNIAKDLAVYLSNCNQEVPQWLNDIQ